MDAWVRGHEGEEDTRLKQVNHEPLESKHGSVILLEILKVGCVIWDEF
jgi:hypothetical protein